MVGPVRQLRGVSGPRDQLDRLTEVDLSVLLADVRRHLVATVDDGCVRAWQKYGRLFVPDAQPPMRAGDMLVANNWGPFDHAMLAITDSRMVDGRWESVLAQCVTMGCSRSPIVYPVDITAVGQMSPAWDLFLSGRAYNTVRIVRNTAASPELLRRVVDIARRWTGQGSDPAHTYHIHRGSVLQSRGCLRGAASPERAARYMALAEGGDLAAGAPGGPRQMCSEMAVGAWVAAIGLEARDRGESLQAALDAQMPVHNAAGCWPRHVWSMPAPWEQVGVVGCAAVASGR
jgi:hypothetical protein